MISFARVLPAFSKVFLSSSSRLSGLFRKTSVGDLSAEDMRGKWVGGRCPGARLHVKCAGVLAQAARKQGRLMVMKGDRCPAHLKVRRTQGLKFREEL